MEQPIKITRGRTLPLSFLVSNKRTGAPYVAQSGEVFLFGIKKDPKKEKDPIFCKAATADTEKGDGWYLVTIHPEDTINLDTGVYYYDIGLESGGAYLDAQEKSAFTILDNVTKKGDSYD